MSSVVADTHSLIWYLTDPQLLSPTAMTALDQAAEGTGAIHVCTITLVEIIYLVDKGKLPASLLVRINEAIDEPDSPFAVVPLDLELARMLGRVPRKEVPDMPDRIIAATALYLGLPLVTRDGKIRASRIQSVW